MPDATDPTTGLPTTEASTSLVDPRNADEPLDAGLDLETRVQILEAQMRRIGAVLSAVGQAAHYPPIGDA